jgi:DNA-binding NtrC family response regulator
VDHFLRQYSQKGHREITGISSQALKLSSDYGWPGNVRELEHTIERIVILEDGAIIQPEHLPSFIFQRQGEFQAFSDENYSLEELEKRYIQFILRRTKGRRQEAARLLGINRKTLSHKIEKYRLQDQLVRQNSARRGASRASAPEPLSDGDSAVKPREASEIRTFFGRSMGLKGLGMKYE